MISQDCIDRIKSTADAAEVIGQYVKLKKHGNDYKGLCPFHNEKTPSFTIHNNRYKCFGCGRSGDVIQFLNDHQNLNYIQAIELLAKKYSIEIETRSKEFVKPIPRLEKLSPETIQYFEKRGISNNTLLRLNITEAIEWMPKVQKEVRTICFNYYKDGELVNIKFRAKDKDFKLSKDAQLIFYNLDAIKDDDTAVIVEGEIDCLSLHEAGIYNVVSVPNGAESKRLEYLDNCWQYFENKQKVIIMTDNDQPGLLLRDELARRIGKDKCYRVDIPADCKDANDILIKHSKQGLAAIIENARRWPVEGVLNMEDLFTDIVNYYEHGYPKGYSAGIGEFDDILQFSTGQYTTVTGSPGSGKSEFIDYITTSLAKNHGWKFAVCSFENPAAIHATKLMEKFMGRAFDFRKDPDNRMNKEQFEQGILYVEDYFQFINISQADVTIDGILSKMRELVVRFGIKGAIIDPWNYIEHKVPAGQTETQYISETLTLIKEFCIKNDVHLFLVAHPRKLIKDQKTGQYPVATMYDVSGSAHFFNKTDNGISIHRDFSNNVVTVYVQKVRFSWLGRVGWACYSFDTLKRQYNSL
ncbi:MAG: toprim domain-containing protein [Chitinophagaceae bacterium]|nr:toprim domain-containing protein [Chitinophagaceae bacterium]